MPDYIIWLIVAIVVVVILWIIFSKVLSKKKLQDSTSTVLSFDIQVFINALGGINNIKQSEATLSKITVYLEDDTQVDATQLKELGASGIVQSKDKVSIILGKVSKEVNNQIQQLK